jgi:hypothetical protein
MTETIKTWAIFVSSDHKRSRITSFQGTWAEAKKRFVKAAQDSRGSSCYLTDDVEKMPEFCYGYAYFPRSSTGRKG